MRYKLDPLSASGLSVAIETTQPVVVRQSGSFAMKGDGVPSGGSLNQVIQKSSSYPNSTIWGIAITVSSTQPTSPAVNDLWIDTT